MEVLQELILEDLILIGEWKDLIMQNLPQIDHQILEIGELAVKRPEEELVLQQVDKLQVEEEIVILTLLNDLHLGQILIT